MIYDMQVEVVPGIVKRLDKGETIMNKAYISMPDLRHDMQVEAHREF